ncbi:MAG: Formation of crista junctions protein 1 [Thelocarpon impressellum]|nr:MAG: Formation of crista junctions protein 1 [Thelocarpon impressellum]
MLRTSLLSNRTLGGGLIAPYRSAQWLVARRAILTVDRQRYFADTTKPDTATKSSIADSKPVVLPGSASTSAQVPTPPAPGPVRPVSPSSKSSPGVPAIPSSPSTIAPENVPLTPPPPPGSKPQSSPPSPISNSPSRSVPPPPPPPAPQPPRKRRRFRRFLFSLILLTGLGYGAGVYYALVSDNFHDFFTEYVPYGEEAVGYFEEREFRRRFPKQTRVSTPRDTGNKVTIPSKSGVGWKVSDGDGGRKDRSTNATASNEGVKSTSPSGAAKQHPADASKSEKTATVEKVKSEASSTISKPSEASQKTLAEETKTKSKKVAEEEVVPKKEEPKIEPEKVLRKVEPPTKPLGTIDPLNIKNADEPLVQDLVKIVNNIITVVNADNSSGKFSTAIDAAKSELAKVGGRIMALKEAERKAADDKVKESHEDFDRAARELVRRLEEEVRDQEIRWKDDFESEREKISKSYQEKLKAELERSTEVSEQRLRNQLLEQAIEMKQQFAGEVRERVEQERDGRLGKLSELASNVTELEKLTSEWNEVVEANLKTQHLHVALEAVRASIDGVAQSQQEPRPFIRELAALKETAADDPVVSAAISSLDPVTYHRGVPTPAMLIERFRRVAAEVRKAALLPADAGAASAAASVLLSKVLFRKRDGLASGDGVESVLTRAETLLEEGDLDGAAREVNGLEGWAKALSRDWLRDVRQVLEVQQALDVIATEARLQSLRVE